MDSNTLQRIQDLLSQHNDIGVVVGKNPTLDQMASALSLFLYIESLGKKVSIACPTDAIVEISSLVGIDKVKNTLGSTGGDLTVSFPYKDNEIQKVSYTIENGFLNIVVKAGETGLTFQESDVQYIRGGVVPTLLFVIGIQRLTDLGTFFDVTAYKDTVIINIDNNNANQKFGDVVLVSSDYSSISEEVAQFLFALSSPIDPDIAQNLLSGIMQATSSFQKGNTTYVAFEMAGFLMRNGAKRIRQLADQQKRPQNQEAQQAIRTIQNVPNQNVTQNVQPKIRPQDVQNQMQQMPKQSQPQSKEETRKLDEEEVPDWLAPKVYKGPTNL